MAKTLESRPSLFEPYGHSDLYALDNLYFSAPKEVEVWDFSRIREFSPLNLGFLLARAELRTSDGNSNLEVKELSPSFRKGICLTLNWEEAPGVRFDSFLPKVMGAESDFTYSRLKEGLDLPFGRFFSDDGFCLRGEWKNKKYLILFASQNSEAKNLPELLRTVSRFSSENEATGNFFLRTEKQSYLNFIKPKESLGALFLQEKKMEYPPFLFLSLETSVVKTASPAN
ncbi:hypothetical protein CH371_09295 [Leptospira wolffii]|uniref:Uncharacterized protein n=1 Tax=Leptospira wolffii TaxID=409998 RepID=A0A2M9ZDE3_9LEPT|nr:hypothetical protein [Leptospira wolffii]PJZ66445.1 hypothetical protein CH371_09295 [Leptospira wolffii]